jgi:hypothetical protein
MYVHHESPRHVKDEIGYHGNITPVHIVAQTCNVLGLLIEINQINGLVALVNNLPFLNSILGRWYRH